MNGDGIGLVYSGFLDMHGKEDIIKLTLVDDAGNAIKTAPRTFQFAVNEKTASKEVKLFLSELRRNYPN